LVDGDCQELGVMSTHRVKGGVVGETEREICGVGARQSRASISLKKNPNAPGGAKQMNSAGKEIMLFC